MNTDVCVLLLAGGIGSRMGSTSPKQFLLLDEKPIACHSFDILTGLPEVIEIVVVTPEAYRHLFALPQGSTAQLTFASPGKRRQDSVYNGFKAVQSEASFLCIHDAARPFITAQLVRRALNAAKEHLAAAVGVRVKFTIKETNEQGVVCNTPNREHFWEVQTPQVIERSLLKKGLERALQLNLTVTDDTSLVEQLDHPVKIVEGCYQNIKITTPGDLTIAAAFNEDFKKLINV